IEVEGSRGEQRDQAAGGGDNNIGARLECLFLFIPCGPIAPTVYGDRAYSHKISEALNLLVDLLGKFTGWSQHQGIEMPCFGMKYLLQYGKDIGGRLACTCLGARNNIPAFQDGRNGLGLYGRR